MKIYTSYYGNMKNVKLGNAVFVSVSVGMPKYELPYDVKQLNVLKPYGLFGKGLSLNDFENKYVEKLERIGVDKISKAIISVAGEHENVILLCHEKDENTCHRKMFADWWEEKTGEKISEYKKDEYEQLKLF